MDLFVLLVFSWWAMTILDRKAAPYVVSAWEQAGVIPEGKAGEECRKMSKTWGEDNIFWAMVLILFSWYGVLVYYLLSLTFKGILCGLKAWLVYNDRLLAGAPAQTTEIQSLRLRGQNAMDTVDTHTKRLDTMPMWYRILWLVLMVVVVLIARDVGLNVY